jgi:hypothetical protein
MKNINYLRKSVTVDMNIYYDIFGLKTLMQSQLQLRFQTSIK